MSDGMRLTPEDVYKMPHNLFRKLCALRDCIGRLERLNRNYAPIFQEDPMVQRHLKQLREDYENVLMEIKQYPGYEEIIEKRWRESDE